MKEYSNLEECKKENPEYTGKHSYNFKDITNQKFGKWTTIYYPQDCTKIVCKCECGIYKLVNTTNLKQGKSTSCGKCNCSNIKNLTGQRFGRLVVIKDSGERQNNNVLWLCKCDCGNTKKIAGRSLTTGDTQSCGCLSREKASKRLIEYNKSNIIDLTGRKFGSLTAVYPTEKRSGTHVIWACLCDCGNVHLASSSNLQKGSVQSCGCLNSKEEGNIRRILNSINQLFVAHKKFFINNRNFYFDFYIDNYYVVEYDGIQHFKGYGNKQSVYTIHERDLIKNQYCFDNNIPLIRIPYDAEYDLNDLKLETTRFLLTPENEEEYYAKRS